jgi:uncharacterized protein (DUF58 family)
VPGAAAGSLDRLIEGSIVVRSVRWFWHRRLTERGRFVFVAAAMLGLLGMDTRRALVFVLFCLVAAPFLVASPVLLRGTPRLRLIGRLPTRLTAGRSLSIAFHASGEPGRKLGPLSLTWGGSLPKGLSAECSAAYLDAAGESGARFRLRLRAAARGHHLLPDLGLARTDTFGLVRARGLWVPSGSVIVYPRYYAIDAPVLSVGRRYQPGGIPLASAVGDSLEFVGTREYREGDPPRKIHWRSWARLGRPVVKEYQEEYFSRLALVLDTYLPKRPSAAENERLEAAIVVLASLADHYGRSEEVVDILAAGPDLYEVSTGRSLGAFDNVLEVLASLESCPAPAFETVAPPLFDRLARLNSIVAVLLDWDERREAFVRRLGQLGVAVHVLLVHEGKTPRPWPPAEIAAAFRRIPPAEVAAALAAEEKE